MNLNAKNFFGCFFSSRRRPAPPSQFQLIGIIILLLLMGRRIAEDQEILGLSAPRLMREREKKVRRN
jgi:hypothetical protein